MTAPAAAHVSVGETRHDGSPERAALRTSAGRASSAVRAFGAIGADHALTASELPPDSQVEPATARSWALYDRDWRRFCGARLDPQFWRLDHPATRTGSIDFAGSPVVVVGTGPSLRGGLEGLRRIRDRVHLVTSPRGADALAASGITPDLVLIEHQTALDAHFSVRDAADKVSTALANVPLVAADARTPRALLEGIAPDRLFVPDPLPTWGLWPATAVALGLLGGARIITLLGIDLGTTIRPDPAQAPLRALLALLAEQADARCVDAGAGGAMKRGWFPEPIDSGVDAPVTPLECPSLDWPTAEARRSDALACLGRLEPVITDAAETLALACRVRDGARDTASRQQLEGSLSRLLDWGREPQVRKDVQDGLGASFLPRYWRTAPDWNLGLSLWRPAALAAHEIVRQHASLTARVTGGPTVFQEGNLFLRHPEDLS